MAFFTLNSLCFSIIVLSANNSSGVTAGGRGAEGQSAPWHFSPGNFYWPTGKREGRKKGKWGKRRKIEKREGGKLKIVQYEDFVLFCFVFFGGGLFSLFKTTEICFGSTKMGIFYREKAFHAVKKSGKMTLPLWKIFILRPWKKVLYCKKGKARFVIQLQTTTSERHQHTQCHQ